MRQSGWNNDDVTLHDGVVKDDRDLLSDASDDLNCVMAVPQG